MDCFQCFDFPSTIHYCAEDLDGYACKAMIDGDVGESLDGLQYFFAFAGDQNNAVRDFDDLFVVVVNV